MAKAFIFPVKGEASYTNDWGAARAGGRSHEGIDIFAAKSTPVVAVTAGTITTAGDDGGKGGLRVWLNGTWYYAHLSRLAVKQGQRVKPGDVLGYVGNTGNAKGTPSHLHFGYAPNGDQSASGWANPYKYLTKLKMDAGTPSPAQTEATSSMGAEFQFQPTGADIPVRPPMPQTALSPPGSGDTSFTPRPALETWRLIAAQPGASRETQRFADRFAEVESAAS